MEHTLPVSFLSRLVWVRLGGKEPRLYIQRLETGNRGHIGGSRDNVRAYLTGSGAKTWFCFSSRHLQAVCVASEACTSYTSLHNTFLILRRLRALRKMAVRWWLVMTGELFLLAWVLDTTLVGGRVNRGGIWDIISHRQMRRFHVEVRGGS